MSKLVESLHARSTMKNRGSTSSAVLDQHQVTNPVRRTQLAGYCSLSTSSSSDSDSSDSSSSRRYLRSYRRRQQQQVVRKQYNPSSSLIVSNMEVVMMKKISLQEAKQGPDVTEGSCISSLSCSFEESGDEADDEASTTISFVSYGRGQLR